jgi:hypothetical protein
MGASQLGQEYVKKYAWNQNFLWVGLKILQQLWLFVPQTFLLYKI